MKKIRTILVILLVCIILIPLGLNSVLAASDTTFASMHAALDTNEDDAYYFATKMQENGWTPTITCRYSRYCRVGTCDHLSNANATIVYWSGHGLSDGRFSYYTTALTHHNKDRTDSNIQNGFVNYSSSTRRYQDYIGTLQTNNTTDWIILASCNQMTDSSQRDVYKGILRTRSQRPMKGIIGYGAGALAPDITDNDIAKEFVRLSFDTTGRRRVVYAWMQANSKSGYYNSTALVNSSNIDDTLTSTKNSSNLSTSVTLPTIKYVYYNSSKVVTVETQGVQSNENLLTEIVLNNTLKEGKILEDNLQYSNDIQDQFTAIENRSKVNLDGFTPYMELEMIAEGEDGNKEVIENATIYARYINGIRVSTLPGKGEQIIKTTSPNGTSSLDYSTIEGLSSDKLTSLTIANKIGLDSIIDESTALQVGLGRSKELVTTEYLGTPSIDKSELVYVMDSENNKLVLSWELLDTYGHYIYINAVSGKVIE